MRAFTFEQLDQIATLNACLSVVADLAEPCTDLHNIDRGNLALLLGYFSKELHKVISSDQPIPSTEQPEHKLKAVSV